VLMLIVEVLSGLVLSGLVLSGLVLVLHGHRGYRRPGDRG
jgi:hypothetical protein